MRRVYITPSTSIVRVTPSVETMDALELPVSNTTVDDEAAKENIFVDDDMWNNPGDLWGNDDE